MKSLKKALLVPATIMAITPLIGCAYQGKTVGESIEDGVIKTKINWHLMNDPLVKDSNITTMVRKGTVQLSGFTALSKSATEAAARAREVDGVVKVVNNVVVDTHKSTVNEMLADQTLSTKVTWTLAQSSAHDFSSVTNHVKGHTVQLAGFAANADAAKVAEHLAKGVKGVHKVINNIIVHP